MCIVMLYEGIWMRGFWFLMDTLAWHWLHLECGFGTVEYEVIRFESVLMIKITFQVGSALEIWRSCFKAYLSPSGLSSRPYRSKFCTWASPRVSELNFLRQVRHNGEVISILYGSSFEIANAISRFKCHCEILTKTLDTLDNQGTPHTLYTLYTLYTTDDKLPSNWNPYAKHQFCRAKLPA